MSVVYRLWAETRVREVAAWQQHWLHDSAHGFRPGHGPEDNWWHLALKVEEALLSGENLAGISLDYSKCFDRVPQGVVLRLAEELGMAESILAPLRGMYKQLRRRFQIAGNVGAKFRSTNGILQGCP